MAATKTTPRTPAGSALVEIDSFNRLVRQCEKGQKANAALKSYLAKGRKLLVKSDIEVVS